LFFSSRRRHTRWPRDWSSDVCSSDLRLGLDEPRPAADRFHREAAPELELAADLEGLAAPRRREAHAALAHPLRRGQALLDENLRSEERRVGKECRSWWWPCRLKRK